MGGKAFHVYSAVAFSQTAHRWEFLSVHFCWMNMNIDTGYPFSEVINPCLRWCERGDDKQSLGAHLACREFWPIN